MPPPAVHPLNSLAGRHVVVLPVFDVRGADSLGWAARVEPTRAFRASLDSAIAAVLTERGIGTQWTFPPQLAHTARRNPGMAPDPYQLSEQGLRAGARRSGDVMIEEPLASQLRSLAAFHDARFALLPVEVRFEPAAGGQGRAALHVAVADTRMAQLVWAGDVVSDPMPAPGPALVSSLASHFADLIVAP